MILTWLWVLAVCHWGKRTYWKSCLTRCSPPWSYRLRQFHFLSFFRAPPLSHLTLSEIMALVYHPWLSFFRSLFTFDNANDFSTSRSTFCSLNYNVEHSQFQSCKCEFNKDLGLIMFIILKYKCDSISAKFLRVYVIR